jgi:hypothetical protein
MLLLFFFMFMKQKPCLKRSCNQTTKAKAAEMVSSQDGKPSSHGLPFSKVPKPALRPTQPPTEWVPKTL